jgi:hypothetical protein
MTFSGGASFVLKGMASMLESLPSESNIRAGNDKIFSSMNFMSCRASCGSSEVAINCMTFGKSLLYLKGTRSLI